MYMEQSKGMKGFTTLAIWTYLQPGHGQQANIPLLKEAVHDLCQMTMQKTAGQKKPNGKGKYAEKDLSWDNLERVKFTIICEAVLLVLSGKLDELEGEGNDERRNKRATRQNKKS